MTSLALACKLNAARTPTSLAARAVAAIRRNNGTLLLPGAATPVLGAEMIPSTNLTTWVSGGAFGNWAGTTATADTITTTGVNGSRRVRLACTPGTTYWFSARVMGGTGLGSVSIAFGTSAAAYITNKDESFVASGVVGCVTTAPANAAFVEFIVRGGTTGQTTTFAEFRSGVLSGYTHGNPALRNYLDSAGTDILDSVTQVDQPVGLVLDSMGVLGAELFGVTLNFADAAWTKTAAVTSSGANTFTTNGFGGCYAYVTAQNTKTYAVRVVGTTTVSTTFRNAAGSSGSFAVSAGAFDTGANSQILLENGSLYIQLASAGTITITSISVREIPGNHASQPTTASKPILRRGPLNQLTQSDFQNGVTDAPSRGGLISAATLSGYGGALAFGKDGSTGTWAYKGFIHTSGATYTVCAVVEMTDGLAPSWGAGAPSGGASPFAIVGNGQTPAASSEYVVTSLGGTLYLVSWSYVAGGDTRNTGVSTYGSNNNRAFKVTRYGLFQGTVTASQILAAGGIPLTTTAAASSSKGNYWWGFDGSNDILTTAITTGNEGWVCAGVNFADANVTFFSSGTTAANAGVWLYRNVGGAKSMNLAVANGSAIAYSPNIIPPTNTPVVVSGGWTASTVFVGVDNTESSASARSGTSAPALPLRIGVATDASYALNGSMSATVYCPILPSAADRALIRRFVGMLNGQTL